MTNNINIHDENWVYDSEKRLYVGRGFLARERAGLAAKKAGLVLQYRDSDVIVKSLRGLEALFENLSPAFPNSFSRPITEQEYLKYVEWAEQKDPKFYQSALRDFEVVKKGEGFAVVLLSYPETVIQDVNEYSIDTDFAYKIREIAELR